MARQRTASPTLRTVEVLDDEALDEYDDEAEIDTYVAPGQHS